MKLQEITDDKVAAITFNDDEIHILVNCASRAIEQIEDWEFSLLIGPEKIE